MRWLLVIILLLPSLAAAGEARPLAENSQVEARLKALAVELRCLVCQNQTLAEQPEGEFPQLKAAQTR